MWLSPSIGLLSTYRVEALLTTMSVLTAAKVWGEILFVTRISFVVLGAEVSSV